MKVIDTAENESFATQGLPKTCTCCSAASRLFCFLSAFFEITLSCGSKLAARSSRHAIGSYWTKLTLSQRWNSPSLSECSSSTSAPRTSLPWIDGDVQERKVRAQQCQKVCTCRSAPAVCEHALRTSVFVRCKECFGLLSYLRCRWLSRQLLICRCYDFLGNAGALECSGERRGGDHACLAALAIAAIKLKRKASVQEKAAITRILVKSGMIRDSLVSQFP